MTPRPSVDFVTAAAAGLIETMRVREGAVPLLDRHLARLAHSLAALDQRAGDRDPAALARPFAAMGEARLRLEVVEGRTSVTVRGLDSLPPPSILTSHVAHVPYPHKTTARDAFERAALEAAEARADDALLLTTQGAVAEGTAWTAFWWDGDRLVTPALSLGVLPGIARARIAELADLTEAQAPRGALDGKAVFLANAVRGIVPLAALDGEVVPADPRTDDLARRFWPAG